MEEKFLERRSGHMQMPIGNVDQTSLHRTAYAAVYLGSRHRKILSEVAERALRVAQCQELE